MKRLPSFVYGYQDKETKSHYFDEYDYINSSDKLMVIQSFEDDEEHEQIRDRVLDNTSECKHYIDLGGEWGGFRKEKMDNINLKDDGRDNLAKRGEEEGVDKEGRQDRDKKGEKQEKEGNEEKKEESIANEKGEESTAEVKSKSVLRGNRKNQPQKEKVIVEGFASNFRNLKTSLPLFGPPQRILSTQETKQEEDIKKLECELEKSAQGKRRSLFQEMPSDFLFLLLPLLDDNGVRSLRTTSRYYHRVASNPFHWRQRCSDKWKLPFSTSIMEIHSIKKEGSVEEVALIDLISRRISMVLLHPLCRPIPRGLEMGVLSDESDTTGTDEETQEETSTTGEEGEEEEEEEEEEVQVEEEINNEVDFEEDNNGGEMLPQTENQIAGEFESRVADESNNESDDRSGRDIHRILARSPLSPLPIRCNRNQRRRRDLLGLASTIAVPSSLSSSTTSSLESTFEDLISNERSIEGERRRRGEIDIDIVDDDDDYKGEKCDFYSDEEYDDEDENKTEEYPNDSISYFSSEEDDDDITSDGIFGSLDFDFRQNIFPPTMNYLLQKGCPSFDFIPKFSIGERGRRFPRRREHNSSRNMSNQSNTSSSSSSFPRNDSIETEGRLNGDNIRNTAYRSESNHNQNGRDVSIRNSPVLPEEQNSLHLYSNEGSWNAPVITRIVERENSTDLVEVYEGENDNENMLYIPWHYGRGVNRAIRTCIPFPPIPDVNELKVSGDKCSQQVQSNFPWTLWRKMFSPEIKIPNSSFSSCPVVPLQNVFNAGQTTLLASAFLTTSSTRVSPSLPFALSSAPLADYLRPSIILPSRKIGDQSESPLTSQEAINDTENNNNRLQTNLPFYNASKSIPSRTHNKTEDKSTFSSTNKKNSDAKETTVSIRMKRVRSVEKIRNIHEKLLASTIGDGVKPFSIPWMSKLGEYNVEPRYVAYYEVIILENKSDLEGEGDVEAPSHFSPRVSINDSPNQNNDPPNMVESTPRHGPIIRDNNNVSESQHHSLINHNHHGRREDHMIVRRREAALSNNSTAYGKQCIAVGLSTKSFPLKGLMTGWDCHSYGYHSDDGGIFHGTGIKVRYYGPTFGAGDTVGCGVNYLTRDIFYTLNGKYLGIAFTNISGSLYPTVGVDTTYCLEFNMGESSFLFDLQNYLDNH